LQRAAQFVERMRLDASMQIAPTQARGDALQEGRHRERF
jgi:hypothetical protein